MKSTLLIMALSSNVFQLNDGTCLIWLSAWLRWCSVEFGFQFFLNLAKFGFGIDLVWICFGLIWFWFGFLLVLVLIWFGFGLVWLWFGLVWFGFGFGFGFDNGFWRVWTWSYKSSLHRFLYGRVVNFYTGCSNNEKTKASCFISFLVNFYFMMHEPDPKGMLT